MDNELRDLIKEVIKEELGAIVKEELELRFAPFMKIADELRTGQDKITEQLRSDRKDIDQIKIGQATTEKQGKVIIANQNSQETQMVEAVKLEAAKIPAKVEEMFGNKPFLKKLKDKFTYK